MAVGGWLSPRALVGISIAWLVSCAAVGLTAPTSADGSSQPLASTASTRHRVNPRLDAATMLPRTPHAAGASIVAATLRAPARVSSPPAVETRPCPPEMVLVERTCMDRYEAHLLEQQADGALVPHPPQERLGSARYVAACSAGTKPQAFISQVEAAAACENAGKRLCELTEWYRACTGSRHTTYPYGQSFEPGRCNVGKLHLLTRLHGANPRNWSYADFNDERLALVPGFLANTGEYDGCQSEDGAYDLVGNLHEWVADRVDRSLPRKLPVPAVQSRRIGRHAGNGIFMGGFFSTLREHGDGCGFITAAHDPGYHDYSTGFRCCKDASIE